MAPHRTLRTSAERRERLAELVLRRTALTPPEAALFHEVFPEIFTAHYDRVWSVLRRRGVRDAVLSELVNEVFLHFYLEVQSGGFPESIAARLLSLASGKGSNEARGERRDPVSLGPPSSSSEKPRSAKEAERSLDLRELGRRLLPALSEEHRAVVSAVILRELSHEEAAAELGLSRSTLTSRLIAAKRRLAEMAEVFLPSSQRGGG